MRGIRSCTVLIVEDEWLVRMELADAFTSLGCTVLESASAEHAIEVLNTGADVALLVTDIRLAGILDGWQLAISAREMWPDLPVVYLSANPPSPERSVSGSLFLEKPALMETVIEAAEELLRQPR